MASLCSKLVCYPYAMWGKLPATNHTTAVLLCFFVLDIKEVYKDRELNYKESSLAKKENKKTKYVANPT